MLWVIMGVLITVNWMGVAGPVSASAHVGVLECSRAVSLSPGGGGGRLMACLLDELSSCIPVSSNGPLSLLKAHRRILRDGGRTAATMLLLKAPPQQDVELPRIHQVDRHCGVRRLQLQQLKAHQHRPPVVKGR